MRRPSMSVSTAPSARTISVRHGVDSDWRRKKRSSSSSAARARSLKEARHAARAGETLTSPSLGGGAGFFISRYPGALSVAAAASLQ